MRVLIIFCCLAVLLGCGGPEGKRSYKEVHRVAPAAAESAAPAPAASQGEQPDLAWTTPADWQEVKGSGMRVASFTVGTSGDGSIVILGGGAGGEVDNIKRWAGQVGVTMDDTRILTFIAQQQRITSEGGFPVLVIDLTGETGLESPSALAAIAQVQGHSVFVKLSGKGSLLAGELTNFSALCASLRLADGEPTPTPTPAPGKVSWVAPEGWSETPGSGMRLATLTAPEAGDCSIISLAGEAGGVSANIKRWLGQIGVNMGEEELLAFLETQKVLDSQDGHPVMLIDMTSMVDGDEAKAMLAGIARFGDETIFIKLTGTAGYLKGQLPSFQALCQSLHIGAGQ
jgi:hypothetical protein